MKFLYILDGIVSIVVGIFAYVAATSPEATRELLAILLVLAAIFLVADGLLMIFLAIFQQKLRKDSSS